MKNAPVSPVPIRSARLAPGRSETSRRSLVLPLALLALVFPCAAQDLEPRRWSHLPTGTNFAGAAYAYTDGDISFNPVLRIEDATFYMHTSAAKYIRTFEVFGKSARFDLTQAYQSGRWKGKLAGAPASTERQGFADTILRFAVNLYGAPPLRGKEFGAYRAEHAASETIVGAGLVVQLPTGKYYKDRLINLGNNRFTFRPQLGVVHNHGKWSTELTASAWIFTDNDEFFNGSRLEQDPLLTLQGHVNYTFRPGLWASAGLGYGGAGESSVNGVSSNDSRSNLGWILSLGIPINRQVGLKIAYLGIRTQEDTGADTDTFTAGFSVLW